MENNCYSMITVEMTSTEYSYFMYKDFNIPLGQNYLLQQNV